MRFQKMYFNDTAAAPGISLTIFLQGCNHRCKGCHNPETWSFDGGIPFTNDSLNCLLENLNANGIHRSLCIMGGEPLCEENLFTTEFIISQVKEKSPNTKIYIWTGYTYEDLLKRNNSKIDYIFSNTNYLIDGPYIDSLRDITLQMRGSSNQRIIDLTNGKICDKI